MPENIKRVRAFVASPGDVAAERQQLHKVAREINQTLAAIAPEKGLALELVRWETNVTPGLGADAQDVVNQQIGDYDIFVGIMWKRFGTPTQRADSGTEEEFRRAFAAWSEDKHREVLFYFCQAPSPPPSTLDEIDQLGRVLKFRNELAQKALVWDYGGPGEFADVVRPHLIMVLARLFKDKRTSVAGAKEEPSKPPASIVSDRGLDVVREEISRLARDYDETRKGMPPGSDRTRAMTLIESRMRSQAQFVSLILPELTKSESAGSRLAAIAALKELPDASYLDWLAERVGIEKAFVGFHATLALQKAVRRLTGEARQTARAAVIAAQKTIATLQDPDPNQVQALKEAYAISQP